LELPVAYTLIEYETVDNIREVAIQHARDGAVEGTLIWALHQTNATGHLGQTWICNDEDLHCTIVLRPEFPLEKHPELLLVSAVSMAHALATHLSAMTALNFVWPNDLAIADHKIASLWIDCDTETKTPWLNITISVNLMNAPADISIGAMSIREAEGQTELSVTTLLETYARQFIKQINNWSERGMEYIVKQWKIREDGNGKERTVHLVNEELTGKQQNITLNGEIELELYDGSMKLIPLGKYINDVSKKPI